MPPTTTTRHSLETPWGVASEYEGDSQQVFLQSKAGSQHLVWVLAGRLLDVSGTVRKRTG